MRISIGDVRLYFDIDGPKLVPLGPWMVERPTLVLVHPGPGFDHTVYKVQLGRQLAEFCQVVYYDQRGHGRSDRTPVEGLTLETWADDLRALCDALAIEKPLVLGHGFGAMVAATYAARHPEHPARLVLVNPAVRMDVERSAAAYERLGGPEAGETLRSFRESPGEETFARFLRVCFPLVTSFELSAELSVRADWSPEALIHFHRTLAPALDLREALGSIRVPTLVVAGEDDPEMTLDGAREAAAALPPGLGRFTSYPRARHAVFRDVPEAFRDVRGFLLEGEDG